MPVPKLYISISLNAKQLWDRWNVRGAILFSLFLQVVLIFVGPIRKSARNQVVVLFIWFAYLMADTAANFAVGQISNSQRNSNQTDAQLPTRINMTPEPDKEAKASDVPVKSGTLNHVEVVRYAHAYFKTFKGLVVDLIFSFRERDESREFFYNRTPEDALRLIEVELNFLYGTLYTKVEVVHSKIGYVFRFFAFGAVLSTLGIFYFQTDKAKFDGVDIAITYTLLLGAIALDVIAFFLLIFSDRTIALIKNPDRPRGWWRRFACFVFNGYLALKKPRWQLCQCKTTNSGHRRKVLVTPTGFRRWSGSISTHNIIRYCLCSKKTTIHEFPSFLGIMFGNMKIPCDRVAVAEQGNSCIGKVINFPCSVKEFLVQRFRFFYKPWDLPFKDFMDELLYVSSEPFTEELWEFIFLEIKIKAEFADTPETAKRISSARGDWVLTDTSDNSQQTDHDNSQVLQDEVRSNLLKYDMPEQNSSWGSN
ncbi:hypothetical protein COLO4_16911 [Corchorus olitorius]|uniref:DUF4220 domain-containing protein n=1 Tax=Corchorus olitorius TaxID=93759 RepID=A0A1R3JF75_9ROSI|nr:hypothetical protein COLO4_16911 [Corchorus olitorius]